MQQSGFTVVADKINYMRFMSHFRSVHRGQFFTTMKTTTVRKLLPESWGFVCPVHTPDGGPCGLLNHLALNASVVTHPCRSTGHLPKLLVALGMTPLSGTASTVPHSNLPVVLDGRVLGSAPAEVAVAIANTLRALKTHSSPEYSDQTQRIITRHMAAVATSTDCEDGLSEEPSEGWVPASLEVAYLPPPPTAGESQARLCGPFPGLFLASATARIIRPVRQVKTGKLEIIGPLEQVCALLRLVYPPYGRSPMCCRFAL